jgi:ethanolamine utilization cobalamin adenosyltransferase
MGLVITEAELREMWQAGRGVIAPLPAATRFTPSASDFIKEWGLAITYLEAAPPVRPANANRPAWDRPAEFPVNLAGPLPVCVACGQPVAHKPDHLAQLDAGHYAPKTRPRFRFRGKVDTLHAQVLVTEAAARRHNLPQLAGYLSTLAAYCREIASAEYHERPVMPLQLAGISEDDLHRITHHPEQTLGISHVTPSPDDPEALLALNLLRCQAREAELLAAEVFAGPAGQPLRPDLLRALNRLSNAVYYVTLLFKAGKIGWKIPTWLEQNP